MAGDEKDLEEMSDAELAQHILEDNGNGSDDLTGRIQCSECGASVEFDMEKVFEYVLRKEYGIRVKDLEEQLDL